MYYLLLGICLIHGWYISSDYKLSGIPVLNYHQVSDERKGPLTMTTEDFKWQMDYLKEQGFHTITPDQLYAYLTEKRPLPSKPVLITFDDGYEDNYTYAYPILKENQMQATIFMVAKSVDIPGHLTKAELREMEANGITIGSHTLSHVLLTDLTPEQVGSEVEESRKVLEDILGTKVEYLAYPGGYVDDEIMKIAADKGIKMGFTIDLGRVKPADNLMYLNRIPIFEGIAMKEWFKARLYCTNYVLTVRTVRHFLQDHGLGFLTAYLPYL